MKRNTFKVGVDVGGTFTDVMLLGSDGTTFVKKVASTPPDFSKGIANGIEAVLSENKLTASSIEEVIHGTTVATNALLEKTGAKIGLITTKGFRDVIEIGRSRLPVVHNPLWVKPVTLVPRYLRVEVDERIGGDGEVIWPLDTNSVIKALDKLVAYGVESIGVCLINSPHNPVHEQKVGQLLRERAPHLFVSLSTDIICMLKEAYRTSEVTVNAYVMPLVANYMKALSDTLASIGVKAPVYIMQSSGGMTTPEAAIDRPVEIIECGPVAGVVGGHYMASRLGLANVITLDMGGTTTKAAIIEDGEFTRSIEYEVAAEVHRASRLLKGSGYIVRVPAIDVAEVGSGGGSILGVDAGGVLNVGPRSAGAVPGPACYDIGGEEPTLTDAYVVLGYLNPNYLLGGDFKINSQRSYQAIEEKVAKPLRMDTLEASYGAYEVANSNMMRAITAVSSERGRDPRKFTLFAYGGAGAVHAAAIAKALEIEEVIITPYPGIFTAFGLLFADIEHHHVRAFRHYLDPEGIQQMNRIFQTITSEVVSSAEKWGYPGANVQVERYADLRYYEQTAELTISVPSGEPSEELLSELRERFEEMHQKTYDYTLPRRDVEVINLRIVAKIPSPRPGLPERTGAISKLSGTAPQRKAYFGKQHGSVDVPVLNLGQLEQGARQGPLIIESYDSTIVVPPDCKVSAGPSGTVVLNLNIKS